MSLKKLLYNPTINATLRSLARPFAPVLPEGLKFPVTGVIRVEVPGGRHIRIRCNPTSFVARKLYWDGMDGFEHTMAHLFSRLVQQADVFFDVGANIGYYSLMAASLKPTLQIYSFEPVPDVFTYLDANRVLNGCENMHTRQLAISDRAGELEFFVSRNPKYLGIATHHLTSTGSFDRAQADRTDVLESVKVQTETLDAFVKSHAISKIDLIKLDTEATEHLVLAGARDVLQTHRPVIFCEVLPGKVEAEIESAFKAAGYLLYRLEDGQVRAVDGLQHDASISNDHLMVHPDSLPDIKPLLDAQGLT